MSTLSGPGSMNALTGPDNAGAFVAPSNADIPPQAVSEPIEGAGGSFSGLIPRRLQEKASWLIIPILLLAIGVRLWDLEAGLPVIYHPDEPNYVLVAQNIFKTGDLNPHLFNYPSLFFYLNALAYVPFYGFGKLFGFFHSRADVLAPEAFLPGVSMMTTALPASVMLERLLTLIFGVGCVLLVYLIGRQLMKSTAVGLLAALFMAVSTPAVVNSRTITPDTFVVFFVLFALWGAVQVYEHGKTWHYIVAGVGIGLGAGSKYNGVIVMVVLVVAHFLRSGPRGFKDIRIYGAGLASIVTFFITTPYAVLDYPRFIADLEYEAQHYYNGHLGMEGETFAFYTNYLTLVEGPVVLLALLEIVRGFATRFAPTVLLASFPLVYFIFINQYAVRNDRTLLPLVPFAYLLGASFLVWLAGIELTWVRGNWRAPARWLLLNALVVIAIVSVALPATTMAQATKLRLSGIEVRQQATEWIDKNIPPGSRIAIEGYDPYIDPHRFKLSGASSLSALPPEQYVQNVDYVVFCKFTFRRFYDERDNFPLEVSRYDYMFNNFVLVKDFPHEDYEIKIYQVPRSRN